MKESDVLAAFEEIEPSIAAGLARSVAQGLLLGGGDELEAAVKAPFTDKTYKEERDAIRNSIADFQDKYPKSAFTAELAGGFITGGAGGGKVLGLKALKSVPRLGALMGLGAVEGGIAGAGYAEELEDVPGGVAQGAALGTAMGAGGRLLEKTGTAIAGRFPKGQVNKKIRQALQSGGITDERQVTKELAGLGDDALLADVNANTRALARGAWANSPNRAGIESTLKGRVTSQLDDLGSALDDVTGTRKSAYGFNKEQSALRKAAADPLYAEARSMPVEITASMKQAMKTPYGRKASKDAAISYKSRNQVEKVDINDLSFFDEWKKAMDGQSQAAARAGNNARAKVITRLKTQVVDDIDSQTGGAYSQARAAYAKPSQLMDATETGKSVFKDSRISAEEISDKVAAMSPDNKKAFLVGVVDEMKLMLSRGVDDAQKARKILKYKITRDKLKAAFGDDKAFNQFMKRLDISSRKAETNASILQGSRTAPMEAEKRAVGTLMNAGAEAIGSPMAIPGMLARGAAGMLDTSVVPAKQTAKMARMMFGKPTQGLLQPIFAGSGMNPYLVPGLLSSGIMATQPSPNTLRKR